MNKPDVLDQLRDIHLPPPISWWPLAPGWIFLFLVFIGLIIAMFFYLQRRKHLAARKFALRRLEQLHHQLQNQHEITLILAEISSLLRRIALAKFPRQQVAGLQGKVWLEFLNRTGHTQFFTTDAGKILLTAPYQAKTHADIKPLLTHVRQWIKKNA